MKFRNSAGCVGDNVTGNPGVSGARLTGAGFGGACVALVASKQGGCLDA